MDAEKYVKFIEKAIDKTKSAKLQWSRLRDFERDWYNWAASGTDSFATRITGDTVVYLLNRDDIGIRLALYPGDGLETQYFPEEDDRVQSAIIRLYNIVYDRFPNVDKIMDEFINSDW